jgi:hypothetical protein
MQRIENKSTSTSNFISSWKTDNLILIDRIIDRFESEKGKTVIWPAEWTHANRGNPSPSVKYTITGCFHPPSQADKK